MPAPSAAVKKQIDKANDLHKQLYGDKGEQPIEQVSSDETATDIIDALPGGEAPEVTKPVTEVVESVEEAAKLTDNEGGDPSPVEPMESTGTMELDDDSKFEHKYNVLQGKYNAEVPRLNSQIKDLTSELNSMRNLLASLESISTPVELNSKGKKLLKDEEIEDYGSDMIDVIKRAALEEVQPYIDQLSAENTRLRDALSGVSASVGHNARDMLYNALNTEVPNWKELNHDNGFLSWLEGSDAYSGARKGDLLTQAFENNDAARVIAFFKGYLNENAIVSQTKAPTTAAKQVTDPKIDLISMAAPGVSKGSSSVQSAQGDKRVYTHAEIAAFYRDVQTGKYKGRVEEQRAIERDILTAPAEGRIR